MNYRIVVDAGHGGIDSGAVNGKNLEKDFTLQASNYIFNRLNELGIPTVMTRDSDISLPKTDRINKVRQISPNDPNVILISNHINAGGGEGAEVVYGLRNNSTLADMILNNIGEAGQLKRKTYQRRLPENPSKDYYYIIRDTAPRESILIEYGFIDNNKDLNKLKTNLDKYAEGVVKALADYLGVNYTLPSGTDIDKYTVVAGDTLYGIASRYKITVDELKRLNNLVGNTLMIGEELIVPKLEDNEEKFYIVEKGDSLYGIARKYGIDLNDLISYNKLNNLTLSIGQKLLIPKKEEKKYIVKRGDTLYKISREYNVSIDDLIKRNNLDSTILTIGEELIIPIK